MSNIPGSFSKIQVEDSSFRSSISEKNFWTKVGAIVNQALSLGDSVPVGTIEMSMLSEAQFQSVRNTNWVLCDGRSLTVAPYVGNTYTALTGLTSVPDRRGRFLRVRSYASGNNPNGDSAIGVAEEDEYKSHSHTPTLTSTNAGAASTVNRQVSNGSDREAFFPVNTNSILGINLATTGGAESRPDNITVNFFIRIN